MNKANGSLWRARAAPIIAKVLTDFPNEPERSKALREAYPFGPRQYHPYKIWLDEIKRQTGRKGRSKPPYTGQLVFGQRPDGY